jgi:hypothetical protein
LSRGPHGTWDLRLHWIVKRNLHPIPQDEILIHNSYFPASITNNCLRACRDSEHLDVVAGLADGMTSDIYIFVVITVFDSDHFLFTSSFLSLFFFVSSAGRVSTLFVLTLPSCGGWEWWFDFY